MKGKTRIKLFIVGVGWGRYGLGVPYFHVWIKGLGLLTLEYWHGDRHWWKRLKLVFDKAEEPRVRWHRAQDPDDHRLWIYLGNSCLGIEAHFLRQAHHCSVGLDLNSGDGGQITVNLCLPRLFSLYISLESLILRRLLPGEWVDSTSRPGERFWMPVERQIGIRIFDGTIWVSLWENPMEWSRSDPWWWKFNFSPIDFLLGRERITSDETSVPEQPISVRMPESIYTGKLKLYTVTRKRPRWLTTTRISRYSIEMDTPVPVPGKDAIHALSGPGESHAQAAIALLDSVNTSRVRYGGTMWLPGDDRVHCTSSGLLSEETVTQ